jgi:hypothetical protein
VIAHKPHRETSDPDPDRAHDRDPNRDRDPHPDRPSRASIGPVRSRLPVYLPIFALQAACGGRITSGTSVDASAAESSVVAQADRDATDADAAAQDAESDGIYDDVWCEAGHAVPICVEYYAILTSCFQHDYGSYACADPLVPKVDADVSAIEGLCAFHLRGSRHACP